MAAKVQLFSKISLILYIQNISKMDFSAVINSTYTLLLLVLLVLAFLLLALYYGLFWLRTARHKGKNIPTPDSVSPSDWPSVSVVMVAHNEADYLKESLPYLLEQDYPNYEVVVVDYTSQDDTPFVLRVCSENYPKLKPVNFPEDVNMFRGKKYPLSIGIKSATKNVILLTEPDSVPKDFGWISHMMCGHFHGASIVMGYSLLKEGKGLLHAFQQYENLMFNASSLGMALLGNPYTATGRNLAFQRDFFFRRGGFISHYTIPDGADDLFVNQNANRSNTTVITDPNAAVITEPRPTFALWHQERLHRYATRRYYNWKDKLQLVVYPAAQVLFWATWLLLLLQQLFPWQILAALLAVKFAWQIVTCALLAKKFNISKIQFFAPFFELYFLFANTILYLLTLRKKNLRWR